MEKCLLVRPDMRPIPTTMKILADFGEETVAVDDSTFIRGDSLHLEGTAHEFAKWLAPFDGFWMTDSPMLGAWKIHHISEDVIKNSIWMKKFDVSWDGDAFTADMHPDLQKQFSDYHRKELWKRFQETFRGKKIDHEAHGEAIDLTYQYLLELYLAGDIAI